MLQPLATRLQDWNPYLSWEYQSTTDRLYLLVTYRDAPALAGSIASFPWISHEPVRVEWLNDDNQYRFDRPGNVSSEGVRTTPNIPTDDEEFQNVCEPIFARHQMSIGEAQFNWAVDTFSTITEDTSEHLHSKYGTYSAMMRAPDSDICTVPGVTEAALMDLKYGSSPQQLEPIEDLHGIVCPECEAGWYWPVDPFETPLEHSWGVVGVECPMCSFGPIDRSYCMAISIETTGES